eukprot:5338674-Amphidinium_carterae.2
MQLRFVHRLPASRQRVGELGRLSGDTAATPPMPRFSRVLATPIREEQRVGCCASMNLVRRRQFLRELDAKSKGLHASGDVLPEHSYLGFFALLRKGGALKNPVVWSAKVLLAKGTRGVFVKGSGPAVIHPEPPAGGVKNGSGRVIVLGCQLAHSFQSRAIQAPLDAMEVGPPGDD